MTKPTCLRMIPLGCAVMAVAVTTWAQSIPVIGGLQQDAILPIPTRSSVRGDTRPTILSSALAPFVRGDLRGLSAASCASSGCHGGSRPGVSQPAELRGGEYPLWLENDPHARSQYTIRSPQSADMMKALGILRNGQIVDNDGYANCLACHNSDRPLSGGIATCGCDRNSADDSADAKVTPSIGEGVGCASCHGPAEVWINTHFSRSFHSADRGGQGFVELSDLLVRARVCASCHIGDADRDMNHDIIAAGHPALRYEFATYHNRLPKHWRDEESRDADTYEAKLWMAGQIAGLDASLQLLQARAARSRSVSVWPELSEYECASCHHEPNHFQELVDHSRQLSEGIAAYSLWNQTGLPLILRQPPERIAGRSRERSNVEVADALLRELQQIKTLMESGPQPDPVAVCDSARRSLRLLDGWLRHEGLLRIQSIDASRLNQSMAAVASHPLISSSWETAVQYYLAVVAGREGWPGGTEGHVGSVAKETRRALGYPRSKDMNVFPLGGTMEEGAKQLALENLLESLGQSLTAPSNELE